MVIRNVGKENVDGVSNVDLELDAHFFTTKDKQKVLEIEVENKIELHQFL